MNTIKLLCAAGAAVALLGTVPASAQPYGYYGYEPVPYYYAPAPYPVVRPYGGYPAYYYGGGGYDPHREAFVDADGYERTRCRAHRACYNPGPNY